MFKRPKVSSALTQRFSNHPIIVTIYSPYYKVYLLVSSFDLHFVLRVK